MSRRILDGVRFPIPWFDFGFPVPWRGRSTTVAEGPVAWAWAGPPPELGIAGLVSGHGFATDRLGLLFLYVLGFVIVCLAAGIVLQNI